MDIIEQFNDDGTLQYFVFKHKGGQYKVSGFYEKGQLKKIIVPASLRLTTSQTVDTIRSFQTMTRTRPSIYDRNPKQILTCSAVGAGFVGTVQQWSYTVPIYRKAIVEYFQVSTSPIPATAAGDSIASYILLNGVNVAYIQQLFNGATDPPFNSFGNNLTLYTGDVLEGYMSANTIQARFTCIAKIVEFDA